MTALTKVSTAGSSSVVDRITAHGNRVMIAVALLAVLGIVAVGGGIYWKRFKSGQIDSIAVLPLDMRNTDPESDYISDGIAESISNSLAQLPSLKVIPYSVALHYKGKAVDIQKTGDALQVQTLLTGRVAQHGDNLNIGVELDDVRNGKQLWGQQYSGKVGDLLRMESDIAREVSQRLRSNHSADRQKLAMGSTQNPEAYQLYLKGVHYTSKFTKDGFDKGINNLNQAIALDPNYALAYSALAYNYINQADWFIAPKIAGPKARQAAQKALELDESNAEAHVVLAIESQWYEWDWAGAECEFKRAIELNPDSGDARGYYSWFLPTMGRGHEAVAEARRGLQTDPLSTGLNGNLGSVFVFTHQWEKRSSNCVHPSISIQIIGSITTSWAERMSKRGDFPRPLLPLSRRFCLRAQLRYGPVLDTPTRCRAKAKRRRRSSNISMNFRFTNTSLLTILQLFMRDWEKRMRHLSGSIALIRSDPIY